MRFWAIHVSSTALGVQDREHPEPILKEFNHLRLADVGMFDVQKVVSRVNGCGLGGTEKNKRKMVLELVMGA